MVNPSLIIGFLAGVIPLSACYAPFKAKTSDKMQTQKFKPEEDPTTKADPASEDLTKTSSHGNPGPITLPYSHPNPDSIQNGDTSKRDLNEHSSRSLSSLRCEDKDPAPLYYSKTTNAMIYCHDGRWTPISLKTLSYLRDTPSNQGIKNRGATNLKSEDPHLEVLLPNGKRKKVIRSRNPKTERSTSKVQKAAKSFDKNNISPENYRCRPTDESKSNFHCLPSVVAH